MSADERTKRYVWVRCGGRCVICKKYLLLEEFDTGAAVRAIGEVAHIAGESEAGPRGTSTVPVGERNDPDNLVLLCPNDHRAADKKRLKDPQYSEAYLNQLKLEHEAFVEFATGLSAIRTTTILRVFGGIRTAPGNVARDEAATVVMNYALRVPRYLPDPSGVGVEIDLRSVPDPIDAGYWSGSLRQIDAGIERLHRDVAENNTTHVSVFAITDRKTSCRERVSSPVSMSTNGTVRRTPGRGRQTPRSSRSASPKAVRRSPGPTRRSWWSTPVGRSKRTNCRKHCANSTDSQWPPPTTPRRRRPRSRTPTPSPGSKE